MFFFLSFFKLDLKTNESWFCSSVHPLQYKTVVSMMTDRNEWAGWQKEEESGNKKKTEVEQRGKTWRDRKSLTDSRRGQTIGLYEDACEQCIHTLCLVCGILELSAAVAERWGGLPWWPLTWAPKYSHVQLTPSCSDAAVSIAFDLEVRMSSSCMFFFSARQHRSNLRGVEINVQ